MEIIAAVAKKIYISLIVALIIVIFSSGWAYAQDPGIPDTIRFGEWGIYLPCPPCTGYAVVPLIVYNDEYLLGMYIILHHTGPVSWDTAVFVGERAAHMNMKVFGISQDMMGIAASSVNDTIPPGNGVIVYLYLTVSDTGLASVDTMIRSEGPQTFTNFTDIHLTTIIPEVVLKSEYHLVPQNIPPGDVNGSGEVNIVDAVFLVNYLFRSGLEPPYPPCSDPNIDCLITISDAVYLVNYVFKNVPKPQLGCAS